MTRHKRRGNATNGVARQMMAQWDKRWRNATNDGATCQEVTDGLDDSAGLDGN